jgi:hypothetical protein
MGFQKERSPADTWTFVQWDPCQILNCKIINMSLEATKLGICYGGK